MSIWPLCVEEYNTEVVPANKLQECLGYGGDNNRLSAQCIPTNVPTYLPYFKQVHTFDIVAKGTTKKSSSRIHLMYLCDYNILIFSIFFIFCKNGF